MGSEQKKRANDDLAYVVGIVPCPEGVVCLGLEDVYSGHGEEKKPTGFKRVKYRLDPMPEGLSTESGTLLVRFREGGYYSSSGHEISCRHDVFKVAANYTRTIMCRDVKALKRRLTEGLSRLREVVEEDLRKMEQYRRASQTEDALYTELMEKLGKEYRFCSEQPTRPSGVHGIYPFRSGSTARLHTSHGEFASVDEFLEWEKRYVYDEAVKKAAPEMLELLEWTEKALALNGWNRGDEYTGGPQLHARVSDLLKRLGKTPVGG